LQWCAAFEPHATARAQYHGYAELVAAPRAAKEESQKDVKVRYAALRIGELIRQAPGYSLGVLVRSNDVVAHLIYELRRQGVPASEEGGNPLTDSPAVQVLLSLLKLADHPGDTVARFHVATSPLGEHLGQTDHQDPDRAVALASDVRERLLHDGYGPAVLFWSRLLEPHCDTRDRKRLRQLVEMAYAYEPLATLRTADFLLHVAGERVADPTTAEVRVMTVHQAKGLQFDIVVLPDLDVSLTGQPPSCVVGQPSPTAPIDRVCLYRQADIQRLLPPELRELFDIQARRSVSEALCVLYVAMTRAAHALYMIVEPSSVREKSLHKKSSGLLRAALTDGQPLDGEQVGYRCGEPDWYAYEPPEVKGPVAAPPVASPVAVRLAPMPYDERLEHTAPSALEGGSRVAGRFALNLDSVRATAHGTLVHALFEHIGWLEDGVPDRAQLWRVAEKTDSVGLDIALQLELFDRMLAAPEIAAVLRRDYYRVPRDPRLARVLQRQRLSQPLREELHHERRFAVRDAARLLSGAIDRLVLLYAGERLIAADIVDFKTDAIARDDRAALEHAVSHYQPQLDAYRRAVAALYRVPLESITGRLLFVSPGLVRAL
jgi:ATP-dependent exoDNAse (exonuclease V) beta subunit